MRSRKRSSRGFTLIELGIVIGVIAVLATIVIVGRGFLVQSRVSKVIEAIDNVQKAAKVYAGTTGGIFRSAGASTTLLNDLFARQLLSFQNGDEVVPDFTFSASGHAANGRSFYVTITCTNDADGAPCADIMRGKLDDRSLGDNTATGLTGCTDPGSPPATASAVTLCFNI